MIKRVILHPLFLAPTISAALWGALYWAWQCLGIHVLALPLIFGSVFLIAYWIRKDTKPARYTEEIWEDGDTTNYRGHE